jgi:hypothetical protein
MKDRFVKLNDLQGFDDEFLSALAELEQNIFESYNQFMRPRDGEVEHSMFIEFKNQFGYSVSGKKYLKLVSGAFGGRQTSVWGFIAKSDFKVKNKKKSGGEFIEFKEGDLLKSASWSTPTLNASRGNIFQSSYNVQWTGPNYL